MRKLKLFKSLLVVATLLVGGNAWAADTFLTTWTGQVGTATNDGNFKYATKNVKIAAGETYVYTLTNFNDGNNSNYWKNWVVEGNLGSKYFDCEARGNQWQAGSGPVPSYTPVMAYTDVENFQTAYNGANVTITISRNAAGDQFTVTHTSNVLGTTDGNTDKYYGGTWTVAVGAEEEWDIYITEEEAHFVVTSVTYTDAESNVTTYNPLYERGYTTAWSAGDIAEGKWVQTNANGAVSINATKGLYIASTKDSGHTNSYEITNSSQISPSANSTIFIDAIWNIGSAYGTDNYNYLKIGSDIEIKCSGQNQNGYVVLNGVSNAITDACQKYYKRDNDIWTIHIEINTATNTVTNLTINGQSATNGNTTKQANITLSDKSLSGSATYNTIAMGNTQVSKGNSQDMGLVSFMVSEKPADVTYANYTVHFVDGNGATVKEDEVRNGEVGSTVNANSADQTTFYSGGNKYVYSNDGDGVEVTNDGLAELTVTYTKYGQYTYNVYAVNSSSVKLQEDPIATATVYEDETATLAWSKYIKIDDSWYLTSENSFGTTATEAGSKNVVYSPSDITYFVEGEKMNGYSAVGTKTGTSYSGGLTGRSGGSAKWYTEGMETTGCYVLTFPYERIANSSGSNLKLSVRDSGGNETDIETANLSAASGTYIKENIYIPAGSGIQIAGTGSNSNYGIDYITLKKIDNVSKTITAAGWATYCSPYALDFSGDIANLTKAYLITGSSSSSLTLEEITGTIPANTGILLEGEGEVAIPVVVSSDTDVSANKLVGVTKETAGVAAGIYVLMNGGNGVGFYHTVNAFTVGANTAYLPANFAGTSARAFFGFGDDEATGISNNNRESIANNGYYNLNGQRVAQPTKGLYIVDGKKVVIKK